jgi:hypothetical protein
MTSDRRVGGYEFKNECTRIRNASTKIGEALSKIINDNPGPQTLYALMTKIAIENLTISNAINNIEKIGAHEKGKRT